jgi:hypothetical protein
VDQSDRATNRIHKINRAAIGDVDAEADASLIRHDSIAILEAIVSSRPRFNYADLFPVNLLRRHKRHRGETVFASDFPMNAVQPRERFRLVVGHFEAGHTQSKAMR